MKARWATIGLAATAAVAAAIVIGGGGWGSARAQAAAGDGGCAALMTELATVAPLQPGYSVEASTGDECRFGDVTLAFGRLLVINVKTAVLTGWTRAAAPGAGVSHRRMVLGGVTQSTLAGTPGTRWMMREMQTPLQVVFDLSEDAGQRTLTVNELSVSGEFLGKVSLDGVVEKVGADTGPLRLPDLGGAALRSVHVRSDSKRMLLRFAVPFVGGMLRSDDPEAEVARGKARVEQQMRLVLTPGGVPAESIEAVAAYIRAFPRPQLVLDVALDASAAPVGADDVEAMASSPVQLLTWLRKVKVLATYAGEAQ